MIDGMPIRAGVTMRTHKAFRTAHELAASRGHAELTPVHILLAIVREGRSPAVVVLYNRGVQLKELEQELEKHLSPLTTAYEPEYEWTEGELGMLQKAADEAHELDHEYQGCEHILLAILRDPHSLAAEILARHQVRFADAQAEVLHILGSPRSPDRNGPSPAA